MERNIMSGDIYSAIMSGLLVFQIVCSIISIAIAVFQIICFWRVFEKAGYPGWKSIIPIYNTYVLCDMVWGNGLKMFLLLIPIANIYFTIKLRLSFAKVFGKDVGFGIGMIFLQPIFVGILAFDHSSYYGPDM